MGYGLDVVFWTSALHIAPGTLSVLRCSKAQLPTLTFAPLQSTPCQGHTVIQPGQGIAQQNKIRCVSTCPALLLVQMPRLAGTLAPHREDMLTIGQAQNMRGDPRTACGSENSVWRRYAEHRGALGGRADKGYRLSTNGRSGSVGQGTGDSVWVGPQAQGSKRGSKCLVQREPLEDDAQSRGRSECRQYRCGGVPWKAEWTKKRLQGASEEVSELLWAGVPELKKFTTNPTWGQEAGLQHNSIT